MTFNAVKKGFGSRLKEARTLLGYTQQQLADMTEIPLPTLKDYEGGKSIPGGEALAKIAFIGVSLEYLLFNERPALTKEKDKEGAKGRAAARGELAEHPRAGYVYVPLYDVRAAAGAGAAVPARESVVNELAFKEDWIRSSLNVSPADLRLVHVEGDSMEPDLRAGDIILINHTDTAASREGVYVIRMEDALLVKQLQRLPGGILRVVSRNPAYQPFEIEIARLNDSQTFDIIGRVVWACRRL